MQTTTRNDDDDLDTILDLVMELATEVDMHYGALDRTHIRLTVAAIAAGRALLLSHGANVPEDVAAILAKFDVPDDDGFRSVGSIFGGTTTRH